MSATIRSINRPENSFKINYVTLRTEKGTRYNIQPIMQGITIYEDIFDGGITGSIVIRDQNDIIGSAPIIGREFLDISFSARDNNGDFLPPYEKTFAISEIAAHMKDMQSGVHVAVLEFGPQSYIIDSTIRITRSFTAAPHEIVSSVSSVLGIENVDIEQTLHPRKYVFNNERPFSVIDTLSGESQSSINNSTDFVFFENAYGWHYKSLYTLMMQKPAHDITNYIQHQGNTYDRLNLVYHHVDAKFDASTMRKKFLGNEIYTHDPITKRIISHSSDYKSHFAEFPTMNGISFFVEDLTSDSVDGYITFDINDGPYASHSDSDKNQRLQRDICRDLLYGYVATGKMPGNNDITAGIVVDLKMLATNLADREDIFKAGKHLITKVKHELTLTEWWTTIQIQKDSYLPTQKKLT